MSDIVEDAKEVAKVLRLCGQDNTAREVDILTREIERLREQVAWLERERDELRARLASQPQWRDRPMCKGVWIERDKSGRFPDDVWSIDEPRDHCHGCVWYGPIPADTNENCVACGGSGKIIVAAEFLDECATCNGTGTAPPAKESET